jgi:ADP-dependent NAD(P)H-hydrate dehydratase
MRDTVPQPPADLMRPPPRPAAIDKFGCGRVLVVGGSGGMAGAAAMTAIAALRSGAGLVELHVPDTVAAVAASFSPCVMTRGGDAAADGTFAESAIGPILERCRRADAVACGPGLGRSVGGMTITRTLWREFPRIAVFDADSLWALAHADHGWLATHAGPRILTPHAGEMRRFLTEGEDAPSQPARREPPPRGLLEEEAVAMATAIDATVVLKGPGTLITDGSHSHRNATGNPGMATAGSGDVLTGVVAALAGEGMPPPSAARAAAWVHGLAGDLAAARLGQRSLIATDLIAMLPEAMMRLISDVATDAGPQPAPPAG